MFQDKLASTLSVSSPKTTPDSRKRKQHEINEPVRSLEDKTDGNVRRNTKLRHMAQPESTLGRKTSQELSSTSSAFDEGLQASFDSIFPESQNLVFPESQDLVFPESQDLVFPESQDFEDIDSVTHDIQSSTNTSISSSLSQPSRPSLSAFMLDSASFVEFFSKINFYLEPSRKARSRLYVKTLAGNSRDEPVGFRSDGQLDNYLRTFLMRPQLERHEQTYSPKSHHPHVFTRPDASDLPEAFDRPDTSDRPGDFDRPDVPDHPNAFGHLDVSNHPDVTQCSGRSTICQKCTPPVSFDKASQ